MRSVLDKKDNVRAEIIDAARELFKTYGLDKTTMEDIARAAGKGKSSLYYYFSKKEDVFYAVVQDELIGMMEMVETGTRGAVKASEKVRLFFTIQDNAIRRKAKIYPLVLKETGKHLPLFQRLQRESNTREVALFKAILLEGVASGEFGAIRKDDCGIIAVNAITMLHAMQLNLLLDGKSPSEEDRIGIMLDIFVRGLK